MINFRKDYSPPSSPPSRPYTLCLLGFLGNHTRRAAFSSDVSARRWAAKWAWWATASNCVKHWFIFNAERCYDTIFFLSPYYKISS